MFLSAFEAPHPTRISSNPHHHMLKAHNHPSAMGQRKIMTMTKIPPKKLATKSNDHDQNSLRKDSLRIWSWSFQSSLSFSNSSLPQEKNRLSRFLRDVGLGFELGGSQNENADDWPEHQPLPNLFGQSNPHEFLWSIYSREAKHVLMVL